MWALSSGVKVDGNHVDFESHRYLLPIYSDASSEIAWMKAAQMGATVYMMLRILWWLEQHQGCKAGLYFPTKELVENTSKDRLSPLMESCPSLAEMINEGDKLALKSIGKSSFYLMHLEGKASKDSVPMDFVAFDEVRLCSDKSIWQTLERIAHSDHKIKIFMSTAGLPAVNIADRFDHGTQHVWRSDCGCPDGVDLARTFPDCVVDDQKRNKLYLRCPKCLYTVKDSQRGRYLPQNPSADYNSYSVSQLVSKFITLNEVWDTYKRTDNMEEFYNAKLGLPYIDAENAGVTMDQLKSCIKEDLPWAEKDLKRTAMGIDQGAGYIMLTIADWHEGKKRLRHVEVVENTNHEYFENGHRVSPFKRAYELMKQYDVRICVCDAMPNYNDALAFAQLFPSRVFLAFYQKDAKEAIAWGDKTKHKPTLMKAGPFLKFKYTCVLSRYVSMNVALAAWANGDVICPDPDRLVQLCRDENHHQLAPEAVCNRLFAHMCRLIKRYHVTNEETGEGRHEWVYAGKDPHLAHSWNYCNAALERLKRVALWTFA